MTTTLKLQTKSDLHIKRKIWHIAGVSMILGAYIYLPYESLLILGCLFTSFVLMVDLGRLYSSKLNYAIQKVFSFCMREGEKDSLSGMSYMALGAILTFFLFPREVAVLSLIFLGLGDPIASTFGVLYGKNKIGSKSLEGSLAALFACSIASLAYYLYNDSFDYRILIAVPLSGAWGALSELIQIKHLDDNLTLPVLSGFGLWALSYILGA